MSTTSDKVFDVTPEGDEPTLKRVLGPKLLLLFIVGDILGAGVYAVTGTMAGTVGGIVWLPFLLAFIVATLTAFSYLELVTQYPQAAGAALYTHKAFGMCLETHDERADSTRRLRAIVPRIAGCNRTCTIPRKLDRGSRGDCSVGGTSHISRVSKRSGEERLGVIVSREWRFIHRSDWRFGGSVCGTLTGQGLPW